MRRIFKTIEDHLTECTTLEKGVWVHLQSPTKEEVDGLTTRFNLDPTFLPAALDEEESARIDYDSDKQQTLIIVDIPYVDTEGTGYVYSTIPLGIVLCDEVIITVCTRDTPIINDFTEERIRNFWTFKRTRFILQILQRNAGRFLSYLKQIDKTSQHIQEKLEHIFDTMSRDNQKARELRGDGLYYKVQNEDEPLNSQEQLYEEAYNR